MFYTDERGDSYAEQSNNPFQDTCKYTFIKYKAYEIK